MENSNIPALPSEKNRLFKRKCESAGGSKGPVDVFFSKRPKRETSPIDSSHTFTPNNQKSKGHLTLATTGDQKVVRIASGTETGDIARATPVRAVMSTSTDRRGMSVIIKPSAYSVSDDEDYPRTVRTYRQADFGSRKPCNCSKSRCLKLYCECFAAGLLCDNCNCVGCHNTTSHTAERNAVVKSVMSRNPYAFAPKIDEHSHHKGCNCRRSACLKNYCECYGAGIPCSVLCRCEGCRNIESKFDRRDRRMSDYSRLNYVKPQTTAWRSVSTIKDDKKSLEEFEEYITSTKERIHKLNVRQQNINN